MENAEGVLTQKTKVDSGVRLLINLYEETIVRSLHSLGLLGVMAGVIITLEFLLTTRKITKERTNALQ